MEAVRKIGGKSNTRVGILYKFAEYKEPEGPVRKHEQFEIKYM